MWTKFRRLSSGPFLALALISNLGVCAQPAAGPELRIEVVEGQGAINNIGLRRAKDPVVKVSDERGRPVAGATVNFILPAQGAGGTFLDSGLSRTVQTDRNGLASGRGLRPNRSAGQFRIRVTASYQGRTGNAVITQTNAEPATGSGSGKKIAIIALIGGAVAGGVLAASHGSKGSTAPAAQPGALSGAVITPGAPSFGPPR